MNPLYVDETVYLTTCHGPEEDSYGYLRAVDPDTGEDNWKQKLPNYATGGTVFADGTLVCGSSTGHGGLESDDSYLFAFDATSGERLWRTGVEGGIRSPPTVADGTVFVGTSDDGKFRAFDLAQGTEQWSTSVGMGQVMGSKPAVVDGVVYVGAHGVGLLAFDVASGSEEWSYSVSSISSTSLRGVLASPSVVDGTVYVGGADGAMHAVDAEDGERVWKYETGEPILGSAAVTADRVYFGTMSRTSSGTVFALERGGGNLDWEFDAGASIPADATVADGTLYIGTSGQEEGTTQQESSWLYGLDAATGDRIWQTTLNWALRGSLGFSEDSLFAGTAHVDGSALYAFSPV